MTAAEKQELEKLRQEKEKRRKQAKQWNENAKKKWETVSCRLPAGTKARIESTGESINGMINRLILAELERRERSEDQEPTPAADQETSAETSTDQEPKQETEEPEPTTAENETEKTEEKPAITWDVLAEMQKSGNFDFSKYQ